MSPLDQGSRINGQVVAHLVVSHAWQTVALLCGVAALAGFIGATVSLATGLDGEGGMHPPGWLIRLAAASLVVLLSLGCAVAAGRLYRRSVHHHTRAMSIGREAANLGAGGTAVEQFRENWFPAGNTWGLGGRAAADFAVEEVHGPLESILSLLFVVSILAAGVILLDGITDDVLSLEVGWTARWLMAGAALLVAAVTFGVSLLLAMVASRRLDRELGASPPGKTDPAGASSPAQPDP